MQIDKEALPLGLGLQLSKQSALVQCTALATVHNSPIEVFPAQQTIGFWGHAERKCRYRVKDRNKIQCESGTGLRDISSRSYERPGSHAMLFPTAPFQAPQTYALISFVLAPTSSLLVENCNLTR